MRTFIHGILTFALPFFITGCESNVTDVRLPEYRPKLVIAAFLSPTDTLNSIQIGSTMRIYGDQYDFESPGKYSGTISDGIREVNLDTSKFGLKIDPQKMRIEYGMTYHMRIITDKDYIAESSCTIPLKRTFSIQADTASVPDPQYSEHGRLEVRTLFTDPAGEENHYRLQVLLKTYSKNSYPGTGWIVRNLRVKDHLFSDKNLDGKDLVRYTESAINYMMNSDSVRIIVRLYNTEKSYYLYHKSIDNYKGGDNPFSEATPIFSNITGGLGIFTSYTVDSAVVKIK